MALTEIAQQLAQQQLDKRVKSAVHVKPIFMSKDEFEVLLHRMVLDAAEPEILAMVKPLMTIRALGQKGALELLFKIGLVLSELDIPSTEDNTEENER